jgi:hypothetical protein
MFECVISSAENAYNMNPTKPEALYLHAMAAMGLARYEEAANVLKIMLNNAHFDKKQKMLAKKKFAECKKFASRRRSSILSDVGSSTNETQSPSILSSDEGNGLSVFLNSPDRSAASGKRSLAQNLNHKSASASPTKLPTRSQHVSSLQILGSPRVSRANYKKNFNLVMAELRILSDHNKKRSKNFPVLDRSPEKRVIERFECSSLTSSIDDEDTSNQLLYDQSDKSSLYVHQGYTYNNSSNNVKYKSAQSSPERAYNKKQDMLLRLALEEMSSSNNLQ